MPDNAVYVIFNSVNKSAHISIVKNGLSWVSRHFHDVKHGMHKCGDNVDQLGIVVYETPLLHEHSLRNLHAHICQDWYNSGFKIYGAKRTVKYKMKYAIKKNSVFLRIVNSRNSLVIEKAFSKMGEAKAFANGKTPTELLEVLFNERPVSRL